MGFSGWPAEAVGFFRGLQAGNTKSYWNAHKAFYDASVRGPMAELLGELSREFGPANRHAAGVVTGDEVEVDVEFGAEPPGVVEPADFARALDADPVARAAYDRLSYSHKREHVRAIETARKPGDAYGESRRL